MNRTKIRLSPKELELVSNPEWILTKNLIILKLTSLLSQLQQAQKTVLQSSHLATNSSLAASNPKISKGENYQGLPYLILDYPRLFNKNHFIAIRTMFWWGHFFSITLHASGSYKEEIQSCILQRIHLPQIAAFSIAVGNDEWQHHFEEDNYQPISRLSEKEKQEIITNKNFIKLAKMYPLTDWESIPEKLMEDFKILASCLVS